MPHFPRANATITARGQGGRALARFTLIRGDATLAEIARNPSAVEPPAAAAPERTGSDRTPIVTLGIPSPRGHPNDAATGPNKRLRAYGFRYRHTPSG